MSQSLEPTPHAGMMATNSDSTVKSDLEHQLSEADKFMYEYEEEDKGACSRCKGSNCGGPCCISGSEPCCAALQCVIACLLIPAACFS
ncbi:hypothetical protein BDV93DRAFT_70309 [Ceratobasidium sp. AG-I]|nr:hypothetical protein BDV93DRAFT_70309 [Ceratobasidium sp. AG-I]